MRNRMHNARNPNQGKMPKVLCVCSAGLLRSPSLAYYLSTQNYNTRACGSTKTFALIPMDEVLLEWADIVVFVNEENAREARKSFDLSRNREIVLDIPDMYEFRDPELMKIIEQQCKEQGI